MSVVDVGAIVGGCVLSPDRGIAAKEAVGRLVPVLRQGTLVQRVVPHTTGVYQTWTVWLNLGRGEDPQRVIEFWDYLENLFASAGMRLARKIGTAEVDIATWALAVVDR